MRGLSWMSWVIVTQSGWFILSAGFIIGGAASLWAEHLLRKRAQEPVDQNPVKQKPPLQGAYNQAIIFIADLMRGDPLISGVKFEQCSIRGPAFLKFQQGNRVTFCSSPHNPKNAFLSLPEGASILGAILLVGNEFNSCQFENVTFVRKRRQTPKNGSGLLNK